MELGWSLMACLVLNFIFNFSILINFLCRSCIEKIRLHYRKKKQ